MKGQFDELIRLAVLVRWMQMDATLARQLLRGIRRIDGWFSPEAAMMFALLDELQKRAGIQGDLFEIGVHHGKSAVMLASMANPVCETLTVCDVFTSQDSNVSRSGYGDRQIFETNLRRFALRVPPMRVFQLNSKALRPEELGHNVRFFHIDGGHNADEALSDLRLAAASLAQDGVIVVDDAFRPEWPGVTEAIIRFLDRHREFAAVVMAFNKLVLTRRPATDLYAGVGSQILRDQYDLGYPWSLKTLPFLGDQLLIFWLLTGLRTGSLKTQLTRYYGRHPWLWSPYLGPVARMARALLR